MRPAVAVTAALSCLLLSCLLAGLPLPASAEASPQASPKPDLSAALDPAPPTGAGCVVGAAIGGASPVVVARGQADLEHAAPLTAASVFETGSVAKQFVAAAVVLLAQDGKLSLDDDIRRVLPEMPDYGAPITIRHLLNHTSGLREQWSLLALTGNGPGLQVHTNAMILDLASRQKGLNFTPGAEFLYTNTNYVLAAIIVERVSGADLQAFTDQRLFKPLGMSQTRWREDFRTVVPGRAVAYSPVGTGFVANMPFTSVYGNGGLLTTIDDLLRWNAFLDKPSTLPGGQALAAALQTRGQLSNGAPLEYGLGLEMPRDQARRLVAHSGSTAGYKTWLGRYPDDGVSIGVLCNNAGIDPIAMGERIAAKILPATGPIEVAMAPTAAATTAPAAKDLAPYQGLFRNPVSGDLVRLAAVDGRLTLTRGGSKVLTPAGDDDFRTPDGDRLCFTRRGERATEFSLTRGQTAQRFVAVRPAFADGAALADYVGTYYSPELDTRVTVVRQGDALVMRQRFAVDWPLTPSFADAFTTRLRGVTTFVFARDAGGKVTGFGAWAGGARNITFTRQ